MVKIQEYLEKTVKALGVVAALILGVLVLLVVYDALMRYLFQTGSVALQELEWHLFDVVIMLGIAYTLQQNAHVRVDIFYENYSDKSKHLVNIVATLFFILPLSLLIISIGIDFVSMSLSQMEASSDPGGLSYRFLVKSLMPIAFVVLILQSVSEIYKDIMALKALK